MTTEDSTENMPDVIYASENSVNKGNTILAKERATLHMFEIPYYSQAELDRRVAEEKERQRNTRPENKDRLVEAIEQLAFAINSRPDHKAVTLPPEIWSKYRRVLKLAGINEEAINSILDE